LKDWVRFRDHTVLVFLSYLMGSCQRDCEPTKCPTALLETPNATQQRVSHRMIYRLSVRQARQTQTSYTSYAVMIDFFRENMHGAFQNKF